MIVASDDIPAWIADREQLLVSAWTPQIAPALAWDAPYAEALAAELHMTMLLCLDRRGDETSFIKAVHRLDTGADRVIEKQLADRFFSVTLMLARAASRHQREQQSRDALPYKRGTVVGDMRTDRTHLPLAQVLLPIDDPFWTRWHPPFGMDCRCGALPMTRSEFRRLARLVTSTDELRAIEAQLHDSWPVEFLPLLDFRKAIGRPPNASPQPPLTKEQYADVMRLFGSNDDAAVQ